MTLYKLKWISEKQKFSTRGAHENSPGCLPLMLSNLRIFRDPTRSWLSMWPRESESRAISKGRESLFGITVGS